jgi:putative membrane protein
VKINSLTFKRLGRGSVWSAALLALGSVSIAAAADDARTLGIYIQVNSFDIETALLGRAQGNSAAVRQLAEHVSSDHLHVRQGVQTLAFQCNVTPVLPAERNSAMKDHGQFMIALAALKGAAFDKAYLEHEVAFHRAAIDAVRTALLPASQCPALKAHFKEVLPAFDNHLAHAEALAEENGAKH